jgi:hypothetical protein
VDSLDWTLSGLEACLFWSCIEVIVVRVKASIGIVPFSPTWIDCVDISSMWGLHRQITFTSK